MDTRTSARALSLQIPCVCTCRRVFNSREHTCGAVLHSLSGHKCLVFDDGRLFGRELDLQHVRRVCLQDTSGILLTWVIRGAQVSLSRKRFRDMALSQLQCLDENHFNPRTNESKPDFLYCENQRLALETLLRDGREAFFKFLESRGQRGFLSDPELDTLCSLAEPYQPDSELFPENAEEGDPPLSLHYWPDLSDTSAPQMDLGWPDSGSYRGVTRTTVYCQPPIDDQAHIKEVVRRMIAQAQKVWQRNIRVTERVLKTPFVIVHTLKVY